jgi:hypothetical protein
MWQGLPYHVCGGSTAGASSLATAFSSAVVTVLLFVFLMVLMTDAAAGVLLSPAPAR